MACDVAQDGPGEQSAFLLMMMMMNNYIVQ